MKKILTTTFLVLGSFVVLQAAPHLSISEAVKRASSQEKLTQCIAKSYLCVVSEIDKELRAEANADAMHASIYLGSTL